MPSVYYYAPKDQVLQIIKSRRLKGEPLKEKGIYYGSEVYFTEKAPVLPNIEMVDSAVKEAWDNGKITYPKSTLLKKCKNFLLPQQEELWERIRLMVEGAPTWSDFWFEFDTNCKPGFSECPSRDFEDHKAWVYATNFDLSNVMFAFGEVGTDNLVAVCNMPIEVDEEVRKLLVALFWS